jgi:glycerol-3-phosphate acyltransferase PlsY
MLWPLFLVLAFLAGSVPFGLLIARAKGIDIRAHGSGNIGATNVGRVLGKRYGFACFGLDALKGALPVLVAGWWMGVLGAPIDRLAADDQWWWLGVGAAALLGHVFSPWVGFKGGKGVATGFGAFASMWTPLALPTLVALVVWIVVLKLSRMVSLASIVAAVAIPIVCVLRLLLGDDPRAALAASTPTLVVAALVALVVVVKHRSNIGRILRGQELKVKA